MNIVQIIPSFNVGGGELLAVRLCAEIKRQCPAYQVTLISLYDPMPSIVYDEALASGVQIVTLGKKKGFDPSTPVKMMKALRAIKPDVIHTHLAGLRYALLAGIFCNGVQKIHTVHNMASHETSAILKHVHRFAFRWLGWLPVALSEKVQKSIRDVYGVDAPTVFNGIKVNRSLLNQTKQELRKICEVSQGSFTVISIGRLCEQKNHCLLIDAFHLLSERKVGCSLLIVGEDTTDGSYRRILEAKMNDLPECTRKNIHFLGSRKDIPELLMASDIFTLSSDWEGVPLTLLEAMGYGIPVVCTSVGGVPDVITHGLDGLLVPKGDVASLANAFSEISTNSPLAAKLVCNAQEKFNSFFSIEMTAHGYLGLYKETEALMMKS
jgi:glycosyltransferase involved in cell wall biosynthesis